jgi:hypothetical protein
MKYLHTVIITILSDDKDLHLFIDNSPSAQVIQNTRLPPCQVDKELLEFLEEIHD